MKITSATASLTAHTFSKDEAATLYAILSKWKFRLSLRSWKLFPHYFWMFQVNSRLKPKDREIFFISFTWLCSCVAFTPQAPTALNPLASHSLPSIASPGQTHTYSNYPPTRVGVVRYSFCKIETLVKIAKSMSYQCQCNHPKSKQPCLGLVNKERRLNHPKSEIQNLEFTSKKWNANGRFWILGVPTGDLDVLQVLDH